MSEKRRENLKHTDVHSVKEDDLHCHTGKMEVGEEHVTLLAGKV